jgi:hypothetical protein
VYTLKHWSLVFPPYQAPELGVKLHGHVYGHPHFDDGESVTTSTVENAENGVITTYSGSQYLICPEDVDPEYEFAFPNAYNRIFKIETE